MKTINWNLYVAIGLIIVVSVLAGAGFIDPRSKGEIVALILGLGLGFTGGNMKKVKDGPPTA